MQCHMAGERTLPRVLRFMGVGDIDAGCAGCCTTSEGLLLPTSCFIAPCTRHYACLDTGMYTFQKAQGMPTP